MERVRFCAFQGGLLRASGCRTGGLPTFADLVATGWNAPISAIRESSGEAPRQGGLLRVLS